MLDSLLDGREWIKEFDNRSDTRLLGLFVDLDPDSLKRYPNLGPALAYFEIYKFLQHYGFDWRIGPVFIGTQYRSPEDLSNCIRRLCIQFAWFGPSTRTLRLIRIEQLNDLTSIVPSKYREPKH